MFRAAAFGVAAVVVCAAGAASAASSGGASAHSSSAHGGGHSGGGRTTTHYVYVYTYQGGPAQPQGVPIELPLELTDAPLQHAEGEMSPGDVIAQHSLRARAARVLMEPVNGRRGVLPAGAVLAEMSTPIAGLSLWCEIEAKRDWFKGAIHDCLSAQGGKFVELWVGESESHFLAMDSSVVREGALLPSPVAYREALPEERPLGLIGFKWCEADGLTAPPRFGLAITAPGDPNWTSAATTGCRFGVWPNVGDHSLVDVDGLRVTVERAAAPGKLKFTVSGRIMPIARLEPLALNGSVRAADPSPPTTAAAVVTTPAPSGPPRAALAAAGAPAFGPTGDVGAGQVFLSLPVRHALTGVLRNTVRVHGFLETYELPVQQPLFGLPTHGQQDDQVVWCAPRRVAATGAPNEPKWKTTCLAETSGVVSAMEIPTVMMATTLPWSKAREASPIDVLPGPVELPAMTLTYVFMGFTDPALPTRFARVELRLDWGEGPKAVRSLSAPIGPDGVARFKLLEGAFEFQPRPSAAGKHEDPKAPAPAMLAVTAAPKAVSPM